MPLDKICTQAYEDEAEHSSVKVLHDCKDFFALVVDHEEILLQLHYSKSDRKIHLLDGKIGKSIAYSSLSDEQKIKRCSEELSQAIAQFNQLHA